MDGRSTPRRDPRAALGSRSGALTRSEGLDRRRCANRPIPADPPDRYRSETEPSQARFGPTPARASGLERVERRSEGLKCGHGLM
jgi:hypothetical protein